MESEYFVIDRTALKKEAKILLDGKTLSCIAYLLLYLLIVCLCEAAAFLIPNPIENLLLGENILISQNFYNNVITYFNPLYITTGLIFILFRSLIFSALVYPFTVCWATIPLSIVNGEKVTWKSILAPISRARYFIELVIAGAMRFSLIFVWSLLFFIPGVAADYRYELALFIFVKKHEITAGEGIKISKDLSIDFKRQFFTRDLSFIGWVLVGVCTFGVVLLWVACYYWVLRALYFKSIIDIKVSDKDAPTNEDAPAAVKSPAASDSPSTNTTAAPDNESATPAAEKAVFDSTNNSDDEKAPQIV